MRCKLDFRALLIYQGWQLGGPLRYHVRLYSRRKKHALPGGRSCASVAGALIVDSSALSLLVYCVGTLSPSFGSRSDNKKSRRKNEAMRARPLNVMARYLRTLLSGKGIAMPFRLCTVKDPAVRT